jgi:hypothetical protein
MGLKRFVKKITKPISKVLDKVIPNEVKPFLPFAAAAFPFLAPGAFGTAASGIGSLIKAGRFAPQIGGALLQGGLNLTSQLAQEGSEGDFSGLSALLAAGQGAMAVPGAKSIGGDVIRQSSADVFGTAAEGATGLKKFGLEGLAKGSEFLEGLQAGVADDGLFSKAGLKLASVPFTQGSIDAGMATARRALKKYEDELAAYELETGQAQTASDDARRSAIIAAMTAGNHSEDVITETLALLGLKDGGRVGLREGGMSVFEQITQIPAASQNAPMFLGRPAFAPSLQQAQAVFPRLNELEQGVNIAENKLTNIRDRLGSERMGGLMAVRPSYGIQPAFQPLNGRLRIQDQLQFNAAQNMTSRYKDGGITGLKDGGMLDLEGKEMDLRGGGFVPIGKKERADDVPARLSKNEFVMTADAVRAAGGGDVNKGAKRMYETMNRLEARA